MIGVGEMKAESQAGIGNGQMGMGRPPGRSGVSESRDGPRSTSRPVDPGNGDVECATVVPAAWTARAREWWIEEIIELLRLTPARGGVTAIRATARRWVIFGGGVVAAASLAARSSRYPGIALPRSRPVTERLSAERGIDDEGVAMTTAG